METKVKGSPSLIQHKVKPEIKRWIESQAKDQERSQGWIANKILEEAYAKAQEQLSIAEAA